MSKFLRTNGVSDAIDRIISEAKGEITIVSPYLKVPIQLLERLQQAANREVRIILVYGKSELNSEMNYKLSTIKNLERYFKEDLHAKCYLNEDMAIITSMNLHEYSAANNREMGILIEKSGEREVYIDIRKEVKSILDASKKEYVNKPNHTPRKKQNRKQRVIREGFCIRCGEEIPLNPNRPYCIDCFDVWFQFENPDYQENICHSCGCIEFTSMNRPLCRSCYRDLVRTY